MRFITEMELRDLYKTEPFATYVLEPDTKITPGARQFLVDRRVTLVQARCSDGEKAPSHQPHPAQEKENWRLLRLRGKMDCIQSLFLLGAAEILQAGNAVLSEEVMALGRCFRNLRKAEQEQMALDSIQCWGWTEAEIKKQLENAEKSMDISEMPLGLENNKEFALLNHLRASHQEVEPGLLENYWDEEKQVCSRQDLIDRVRLIINLLCMMMRKCIGGKK